MDYVIHIGILWAIYSILGLSLNLLIGYTGLFSMAHATFYGLGAYSTAILMTRFDLNFFVTVLAGTGIALIVGLLIGLVLSRFNDDYYAIVSLGFVNIAYAVFLNWKGVTRGPNGIPGIGRPFLFNFEFSSNADFFVLSLAFLVIIFFLSRWIVSSSFGRVLKTIREDEKTIEVYGYDVAVYKLAVFVAGAMMAAVAGSLFASYIAFVTSSEFMLSESIFILVITILGGLGNLYGSMLGALFLVLLPEALRFVGLPVDIAAHMHRIIWGAILIFLMLYRPQGLVGEYKM